MLKESSDQLECSGVNQFIDSGNCRDGGGVLKIKKLSESTINRIAAGEVVERPASAIKELVENSIDAGAKNISVILEGAGKNLISILDDGIGMSKEEILLAIERHTTSKLMEDDITNISFFGFRGEAIPSISSVSRMSISSRKQGLDECCNVSMEGGEVIHISKTHMNYGTKIEVKDLFFATPARLKFLKSDKTEQSACIDIIKKIALAHSEIAFSLTCDGKEVLKLRKAAHILERLEQIMGSEFTANSAQIEVSRGEYNIAGYCSIPTFNRASASEQYLFVNNRPVRDKNLSIALKVAYQDYLSRDRHPLSVIYITAPNHYIDVNVHPSKTEVRFRDDSELRSILISAIKDGLGRTSHKTSSALSDKLVHMSSKENFGRFGSVSNTLNDKQAINHYLRPMQILPKEDIIRSERSAAVNNVVETESISSFPAQTQALHPPTMSQEDNHTYLGTAISQVGSCYIISQIEDGIIITDQHAAHERLVYEKIKKQFLNLPLPSQRLVVPIIVEFQDQDLVETLCDKSHSLSELGLFIQKFSEKSVIVRSVPAVVGEFDIENLVKDLADNFRDLGENIALQDLIEHVTETYACHHSIRSGRIMSKEEMNALLREMETTPFSGQCNHGRPTYVKLQLKDLEKLFGRR